MSLARANESRASRDMAADGPSSQGNHLCNTKSPASLEASSLSVSLTCSLGCAAAASSFCKPAKATQAPCFVCLQEPPALLTMQRPVRTDHMRKLLQAWHDKALDRLCACLKRQSNLGSLCWDWPAAHLGHCPCLLGQPRAGNSLVPRLHAGHDACPAAGFRSRPGSSSLGWSLQRPVILRIQGCTSKSRLLAPDAVLSDAGCSRILEGPPICRQVSGQIPFAGQHLCFPLRLWQGSLLQLAWAWLWRGGSS